MKRTNIIYWILTGLASLMMIFSGITNVLLLPEAVELIVTHLGYPAYFLTFIGAAKIIGAITILIPGFQRIKEWAYAGLFFDLGAAIYSAIAVGDPPGVWLPIFIFIALIGGSYVFHHKRLKEAGLK
ncbi:MAG: DoxX family protein [Bacteroidia bacterium]|nr:DoxX family protein [Bacteroidia bacterium]